MSGTRDKPPEAGAVSPLMLLLLKGALIGMSDSVPGVSGGTIAVLTGIYARLITAISAFDLQALRLLSRRDFSAAWRHVDASFLLPLAGGMLCGLLLSANTVLFALEHYPVLLGAFFMGLVLGALFLLRGEFALATPAGLVLFVVGAVVVGGLAWLEPMSGEASNGRLFLAGAVAISAMLLPGLSGAFLLLLMGVYEPMLAALVAFDLAPLVSFAAGCAVGILVFSRALSWLLSHFRAQAYSLIGGLLLGSLLVIWPWQFSTSPTPVWPTDYAAAGLEAQLGAAVLCGLFGLALVVGLQQIFELQKTAAKQQN